MNPHLHLVPLKINFHHGFKFYKRMSGSSSCMRLMLWYYMHRCMKSPLLPKPVSTSAEHNLCSFINTGPRGLWFFNIHVKRYFLAHIFPSAVVNNAVFTMTRKPNGHQLNCRKASIHTSYKTMTEVLHWIRHFSLDLLYFVFKCHSTSLVCF